MKIGVFTNYYPPSERGGAELVAQRVADELSSRGHQVFVLSTKAFSGWSSLRPRMTANHVERVYRFFPFNLYHVSNASKWPLPFRLLWHIIDLLGPIPHTLIDRLLVQEEPDIILTHNLKGLGVRSSRCVQEKKVRHIHTLHDVQLSIPSGLMLYGQETRWVNTGFLRRWYERLAKYVIGSPDIVVSPSHFLLNFYRNRGFFSETSVAVLPNPAPKISQKAQTDQMFSGPVRFLFVGQLEPHKGLLLLLDAILKLDIPFELHIAGDGSLGHQITERAKKDIRVFFHGFISLEHIKKIMVRSDAVVLPSLCYENSPTVVYESFQMGVPVIASNIGGIPELIEDGKNGLLFEPGSVEALAFALRQFVESREKFASQRSAIRHEAEKYAIEKYVDQLETLFENES